jgi:signal transduction histidine kinase
VSADVFPAIAAPHEPDLLAGAVRSAGHALAQGEWTLPQEESLVRRALSELAAVVRTVREGGVPDVAGATWTPVARPLLDVLRRQLLRAAAAAGDAEAYAECHALLMAIERVADRLRSDDLCRVTDALAGPEALSLLVEVAHDMRSPLGSILFLVDRVRSGQSGTLSDAAVRQLGLVYSAAFGLSAMASDVMELARGSGRLVGDAPVPFALADVLRAVHDLLRPVAEEKGLTLVVDTVPRDARLGHPAALQRVLLNLATNACKFTEQGEVRVRVAYEAGDVVRFAVEDTGRGVPPEVAARLFETFSPRRGSGVASGGTSFSSAGLGLAISRKLVAAMGGELSLQTRPGGGTIFAFDVPLQRSSAAQ